VRSRAGGHQANRRVAQLSDQAFQPAFRHDRVVVENDDDVAARDPDSIVDALRETLCLAVMQKLDFGVNGRNSRQIRRRVVSRAVVDHHNLRRPG